MKRNLSLKDKINLSILLKRLYNENINYEYQDRDENILIIFFEDYNIKFNLNKKIISFGDDIYDLYEENSKFEIKDIYDYLDNYLEDILSHY